MKKNERRVRYLIVGGFNTLFGLGLFTALDLTTARYIGHYAVLTIAQVIAVSTAHTTQRRWAWQSSAPYLRELARFSSVYGVTYLLNLALLYAAHSGFGAPVIPAQIAITALLIVVTYAVHRVWTFAPSYP
jgi:putative flippase GtrA